MGIFHGYVGLPMGNHIPGIRPSWFHLVAHEAQLLMHNAFELVTPQKFNIEFSPEKMRLRRWHGDFSGAKMTASKSKHVNKTIDELS